MPEAHLGLAQALSADESGKSERRTRKGDDARIRTSSTGIWSSPNRHIDSEEYDKAQEEINKALAVNPKSTEAFSLLASISFVRNNTDDFNKYVKQVLETNPHYSKLYDTLAENCEHSRLYKEAVEFAREALQINPSDWNAMSMLGVNLMRIGEEEEGKAGSGQGIQRRSVQQTERTTRSTCSTGSDTSSSSTRRISR